MSFGKMSFRRDVFGQDVFGQDVFRRDVFRQGPSTQIVMDDNLHFRLRDDNANTKKGYYPSKSPPLSPRTQNSRNTKKSKGWKDA